MAKIYASSKITLIPTPEIAKAAVKLYSIDREDKTKRKVYLKRLCNLIRKELNTDRILTINTTSQGKVEVDSTILITLFDIPATDINNYSSKHDENGMYIEIED